MKVRYGFVPSDLGDVGILWTQRGGAPSVIAVHLPMAESMEAAICRDYPGAVRELHPLLDELVEWIRGYMNGRIIRFDVAMIDLEQCHAFQRRVLLKAFEIPRGKIVSYGRLAEKISAPRAARAVGTALAGNPFPLIFPCHRVIKSTGRLGQFGGGVEMKRKLLHMEGVEISEKGRVAQEYLW